MLQGSQAKCNIFVRCIKSNNSRPSNGSCVEEIVVITYEEQLHSTSRHCRQTIICPQNFLWDCTMRKTLELLAKSGAWKMSLYPSCHAISLVVEEIIPLCHAIFQVVENIKAAPDTGTFTYNSTDVKQITTVMIFRHHPKS